MFSAFSPVAPVPGGGSIGQAVLIGSWVANVDISGLLGLLQDLVGNFGRLEPLTENIYLCIYIYIHMCMHIH